MILIALPPDPMEDQNPKTTRSDLLAIARGFPGQCFLGQHPGTTAVIKPSSLIRSVSPLKSTVDLGPVSMR